METLALDTPIEETTSERARIQRVLLVSETPIDDNYPNGVLTTAKKTLDYFQEQNYDVRVVCPRTPTVLDEYAGYPITTVRSAKGALTQYFPVGIGGANKIPKLIKKFDPEIVLAFSPFGFMSEYAITAATAKDIPLIENYQTDVVGYFDTSEKSMIERYSGILKPDAKSEYGPAMRIARKMAVAAFRAIKLGHHGKRFAKKRVPMLHNQADINLAPSVSAQDEIVDLGVRPESIKIWGRGVDMETYHPGLRETDEVQALRDLILQGRDIPIVGYVGRIASEKNLDELASLMDLDIQMVIVGDGPLMEELKVKLGDQALFVGKKQNPELAQYYALFDYFIAPGKKETYGQTVPEAQASGTPVLAPGIGGPLTTIEDGVTGLHYSPHDKADMRRKLEYLIANPAIVMKIGAQARKSIESKTWRKLGEELEGHMEEARSIRASRRTIQTASLARQS